jgi:hypothetical protein
MLPAPTLRVVFTSFGLSFADFTIFWNGLIHVFLVRLLLCDRQELPGRIGATTSHREVIQAQGFVKEVMSGCYVRKERVSGTPGDLPAEC